MSAVSLQALSKIYDSAAAVDALTLEIAQGELVALLGPSGCGKTTTLRMIGGFVEATRGRIAIGGRDVTALPPARRNIGFGFQNYALFPHMSVAGNVGFGLEMRRRPKPEVARRVAAMLDLVRLGTLAERLPKQLSGGQQQRVALARALVIEPDVLLLDEPLSNLDAQLRQDMKAEIRALQRSLGITTIFVTHDQDEALSIADRVVVMRAGRIEQDGSPQTVFADPQSRFVAAFMGFTNLLDGERVGSGGFRLADGTTVGVAPCTGPPGHGPQTLAVRPERVGLDAAESGGAGIAAKVVLATFRGEAIDYLLRTASGLNLTARRPTPAMGGPPMLTAGAAVRASWSIDAVRVLSR